MIRVNVRLPRNLNKTTRQINEAIDKATTLTGRELKKQFEKTTTTWRHPVIFETTRQSANKVTVATDDPPYFYVNGGTRVRRALMSPDFQSKSRPRTLTQRPGRGGVVFISRNVNQPGIEARYFDKQISLIIVPFMIKFLEQQLRSV